MKKKAIKIAAATAVAASAFVASAPLQSHAASNVLTTVDNAVKSMQVAYHTYSDVTANGQFADINKVYAAYNQAKADYASAKALVVKAGGTQKDAYLAKLDSNYKEYISKRVVTYIDAYNYAVNNLQANQEKLQAAIDAKNLDDVQTYYNAISYQLKVRTVILDRVYGVTARELLRSSFKADAQDLRDSMQYDVTVAVKAKAVNDAIAAGKLDVAKAAVDQINKYLPQTTVFKDSLTKSAKAAIAAYEAKLTPAVENVSAIDGKELVISFNQALDATDAVKADHYKLNGINIGTPALSEDGKVVTITTSSVLSADNATLEISPISTKADVQKTTAKYVTLFSYKDTVAPTVAKVEAKATQAVITFAEELNGTPGLSVNGVTYSNYTVSGKTLTISGLENEKTYSAEIVGAKDAAGNYANPISLNFTVAKPDAVLPQAVTTSVKENQVTLKFVNALSSSNVASVVFKDGKALNTALTALKLDGTDATGVTYSTDKKTVTLDAQALGVLAGLNFLTTGIEVSGAGLTTAANVTATLNSDKTAAQLVSSQTTAAGKLVLEFNEEVQNPATLDLKVLAVDDIYQSNPQTWVGASVAYAKDAQGKDVKTKLEVTLPSSVVVGTKYTVEVPANVKDVYDNATAKFNVSVVKPATDNSYKPGQVITVGKTVNNNVITLAFGSTKDDKGVTTSATTLSNYTLGGKALPTGTQVRYIDDKNHVEIVLPNGSITTTGDYLLELNNITDAAGNTLVPTAIKQVVPLVENVAPVATSVELKSSSEAVVNFSENITTKDLVATGYQTNVLDGVTVKVNGLTVAATLSVGANTLTIDNLNLKATDTVSVEFKNAEIFDTSTIATQIKDSVVAK